MRLLFRQFRHSLDIKLKVISQQRILRFNMAESTKERYEFFYMKQSPFSQFYGCIFEVDGQQYSCAEQYMMHQKAVLFKDDEMAAKILKSQSPPQMKSHGRKVRGYDDDVWNKHCVDVVKKGNLHKFSQNEDIKAVLFATKGKILVEASPRDRKWGIGMGKDNPLALNRKTWKGLNLLGFALTEVRDELMEDEGRL